MNNTTMDNVPSFWELFEEHYPNRNFFVSVNLYDRVNFYRDKYVKFYNEYGEFKIPIMGELSNIRQGLKESRKRAQQSLDSNKEGVQNNLFLNEIYFTANKCGISDVRANLKIKKNGYSFQHIIDELNECLNDRFSMRKKMNDLSCLYNMIYDIAGEWECLNMVESAMGTVFLAFDNLYTIQKITPNSMVLNALINSVLEQDYPEKIDMNYDKIIHKSKIDTFDNEAKNKMKQAAIDVAPMKVDIYEVAYKVISEMDNHLNDFLTGSGDANAELYNPIKIRTNYTKEQVRYHLKTAINEGIDPHLPGIDKKLVDGLLLDLLLGIGFKTTDVNN